MSLSLRALILFPALLLAAAPLLRAAESVPTRHFDGAAREIVASLKSGNGWSAVADRRMVAMVPGKPLADCVRYKVVTGYRAGTTSNDQFYVDLTFGPETDWILVELGLPTQSAPSLTVAQAANAGLETLDQLLGFLEPALVNEENARVRVEGIQIAAALRRERAALIDLMQKDIAAVEMAE